jgi:copper homeostasis protein
MNALQVEIAVTSPVGARLASRAGAARVELCSALELGGITPSAALLRLAVAEGIPVHALIRSRPGDFVYDEDELRLLADDAAFAVEAGASGVVIGALTAEGGVDLVAVERMAAAARAVDPGVALTFHRAIDQTADPAEHLGALFDLGIRRVLTSGGASSAADGSAVLAEMIAAAASFTDAGLTDAGLEIMAGGGVLPHQIPALARLGVDAVHLSAKARAATASAHWVSLGAAGTDAASDTHFVTDAAVIRAAVAAAAG